MWDQSLLFNHVKHYVYICGLHINNDTKAYKARAFSYVVKEMFVVVCVEDDDDDVVLSLWLIDRGGIINAN